jgi:hypothetical protein
MTPQQESAVNTVNAYATTTAGIVQNRPDDLAAVEQSCKQLEAACTGLAEAIRENPGGLK